MSARDALIALAVVSMLASCSFALLGILAAFRMNRAAKLIAITNGRTLTEQLYDAAGVTCWHLPEHDREDCDCRSKGDL
jgi:hypothetical protein